MKITSYNLAREVLLSEVPDPKFCRERRYLILALAVFLSTSRKIPCVFYQIFLFYIFMWGHEVAQLVEAMRYKLEGRDSPPDGVIGIFH
jgi:hypothetical protein